MRRKNESVFVGRSGTGGTDISRGRQGWNIEETDDGSDDIEGGDNCMHVRNKGMSLTYGNKGTERGIC